MFSVLFCYSVLGIAEVLCKLHSNHVYFSKLLPTVVSIYLSIFVIYFCSLSAFLLLPALDKVQKVDDISAVVTFPSCKCELILYNCIAVVY